MNKFKEMFEAKMTKVKVDKIIKSFRDDNNSNGPDRIDDGMALADMLIDDKPEVGKWLEDNGFDSIDYISSRM